MGVIATPKRSVATYIGTPTDPHDVKQLRSQVLDYHRTLGQLVIHKHRWNEQDVRNGLALHCPFHSDTYERGAYDPYCFGTGYLGGYSDGVLVPVTIADTQEDVFRPNNQGILIHERHPGLKAPWLPEMGDTDMIIVVEIDRQGNITEMGDRYEMREVTPVTMRGPGYHNTLHMKPYKVSQEAMIDLLPYAHPLYNVPINFDYTNVPTPVPPDYPPLPPGTMYTSFAVGARITGEEPPGTKSSHVQDARIGVYSETSKTTDVCIVGDPGGTHVHF
jgi:hypothetical protein